MAAYRIGGVPRSHGHIEKGESHLLRTSEKAEWLLDSMVAPFISCVELSELVLREDSSVRARCEKRDGHFDVRTDFTRKRWSAEKIIICLKT